MLYYIILYYIQILYTNLGILLLQNTSVIMNMSKEDNLCEKVLDNCANAKNSGRYWECPNWERGGQIRKHLLVL